MADPNIVKLIEVGIGILIISIISRILAQGLSRQVQDSDLRYRIRKIIGFLSYGFIALLIVTVFNDSLRQLTVVFGVVGAGIAFALQEVIASLAGWTAISLGQFYKTGDRVQLGGIMGDVIDVSPLRTTLMECGDWVKADLYNGRIVRIANSFVFKEPVFNYSGDFPFVWDEIVVPVRHGSDYRLARSILQQVVEEVTGSYIAPAKAEWSRMTHKYLIEDARIEPFVALIANDNWLEFTVRYVVDYKKRRVTKDQLFTRILEELDTTDGRVELASTTVELVAAPAFGVRLEPRSNGNQPAA
ncbi:MAG: mechanosensitive ion channel [Pleurocapsa sp. SU_5_0]|nr:mechanosensitive ion channel [Pleurocapsa sp. SU_5_0]